MDEEKNNESPEKKYNPILQFSPSLAEDFKMYETFGYYNDRDQTRQHVNLMETGNVVKYYKVSRTEKTLLSVQNRRTTNETLGRTLYKRRK